MYPLHSNCCWRNCGLPGTSPHVWWYCPVITLFCKDVNTLLSQLTKSHVSLTPQIALLGLGLQAWHVQLHPMITHVLIAARLALARNWKSSHPPPTFQLCISILNQNLHMEYTVCMLEHIIPYKNVLLIGPLGYETPDVSWLSHKIRRVSTYKPLGLTAKLSTNPILYSTSCPPYILRILFVPFCPLIGPSLKSLSSAQGYGKASC